MQHVSLYLAAAVFVIGCDDDRVADPVDISSVAPDLQVPNVGSGAALAGKRFKEVHPVYSDTSVYHVIYLPPDWQPEQKFPVIVE